MKRVIHAFYLYLLFLPAICYAYDDFYVGYLLSSETAKQMRVLESLGNGDEPTYQKLQQIVKESTDTVILQETVRTIRRINGTGLVKIPSKLTIPKLRKPSPTKIEAVSLSDKEHSQMQEIIFASFSENKPFWQKYFEIANIIKIPQYNNHYICIFILPQSDPEKNSLWKKAMHIAFLEKQTDKYNLIQKPIFLSENVDYYTPAYNIDFFNLFGKNKQVYLRVRECQGNSANHSDIYIFDWTGKEYRKVFKEDGGDYGLSTGGYIGYNFITFTNQKPYQIVLHNIERTCPSYVNLSYYLIKNSVVYDYNGAEYVKTTELSTDLDSYIEFEKALAHILLGSQDIRAWQLLLKSFSSDNPCIVQEATDFMIESIFSEDDPIGYHWGYRTDDLLNLKEKAYKIYNEFQQKYQNK